MAAGTNSKRHHYVPRTYLERFCNASGGVIVYLKDDPTNPKSLTPDSVGHRHNYYAQPTDTGWDHNSFEAIFSKHLESDWPALVDALAARQVLSPEQIAHLATFIAGQFARVPSTRDALEYLRAQQLKLELLERVAAGQIPEPPPEVLAAFRARGIDDPFYALEFAVDPHVSLHALPDALTQVEAVLNKATFFLLHNTSGVPFVTSDNPVAWFDPTIPPDRVLPYVYLPDGHVVLLFPVTPLLLVFGSTGYDEDDWTHIDQPDPSAVRTINSMLCRFAYERVFACSREWDSLVVEHAALSPVMSTRQVTEPDGATGMYWHWVFGERRRKPKWVAPKRQ